jgi:hypothetical protein
MSLQKIFFMDQKYYLTTNLWTIKIKMSLQKIFFMDQKYYLTTNLNPGPNAQYA